MKSYEFFPFLRSVLSGCLSARTVLVGQVLCVFCALLPIVFYSAWSEWQVARKSQQEEVMDLANALASRQLSLINSTKLLLFALSLSPTIQEEKPDKLTTFLSLFEQRQPDYAGFALFRPDGSAIASVLDGRQHDIPQQAVRDHRYFREALSRTTFNVGESLTIPGGRIVLPMTMPVLDRHGRIRSILMAPLSMTRQHAAIKKMLGRSDKNVLLLDAAFKPIFFQLSRENENNGDSIIFLKNTVPNFLRAQTVAAPDGSAAAPNSYTSLDLPPLGNVPLTGAMAVLRHDDMRPYLYILTFEKRISLADFVKKRYVAQITALSLAALLLLLATVRMGRQYFSRGLVQLAYVALQIREGDLRSRCGPVQGCRELAILGGTFDHMLDALQARTEELRALSLRDPLTGLWNRRYFTEAAQREIARSLRQGQPLSLAMADIDHFKKINDTYGHAAGDLVLRHFADLLRQNLRGSDILARFGGEEFIFLFPQTPVREGGCILEKLRGLCETSDVTTPEGAIRVTASFGVTALPLDATAPPDVLLAQLVQRADAALYHSKGQGRNRVTLDDDAPA